MGVGAFLSTFYSKLASDERNSSWSTKIDISAKIESLSYNSGPNSVRFAFIIPKTVEEGNLQIFIPFPISNS